MTRKDAERVGERRQTAAEIGRSLDNWRGRPLPLCARRRPSPIPFRPPLSVVPHQLPGAPPGRPAAAVRSRRLYRRVMPSPPDIDLAKIRKYFEGRVPAELRDEARIDVTVRGSVVTVFDCRGPWHESLTEWSKVPVAQFRYRAADPTWALHWADRNDRWHRQDEIEPGCVDELLAELHTDPTGIFWG
ncbi:MAG TPA: hypothetical protein DCQ30_02270 [Acidimicrobiaceae bacterium]|nr:hypothetical protein [Acidimicrobiaceae bacterium]